ncbi:MAG: methyltransferase, partial [Planctomycetota bacterium]|jgi:SAM-dependent methyltransferase
LLCEGPQTVAQLAKKTDTDKDSLYRTLRALACVGIFTENSEGQFSLTLLAEGLRSDVDGSMRSFAITMGSEFYQTWGDLLDSVKTGEQAFQKKFGHPIFEYMLKHPDRHEIYDSAMMGIHGIETKAILDAYDFSKFQNVADVGGGNGHSLIAILKRHPAIKGTLFDLPAVTKRAEKIISDMPLSDRCQIIGGDFFSSVPKGCDVYLVRHIIHDWQDKEAATILRNCCKAMAPGGKVLVVENIIPPGNELCFGKWLDLMMLLVGGRERTEPQYEKLFSKADLKLNRIIPTSAQVSIIEGVGSE